MPLIYCYAAARCAVLMPCRCHTARRRQLPAEQAAVYAAMLYDAMRDITALRAAARRMMLMMLPLCAA